MVVLGHVTSTEAGVSRVLLLWLLSVLSSKIVGGDLEVLWWFCWNRTCELTFPCIYPKSWFSWPTLSWWLIGTFDAGVLENSVVLRIGYHSIRRQHGFAVLISKVSPHVFLIVSCLHFRSQLCDEKEDTDFYQETWAVLWVGLEWSSLVHVIKLQLPFVRYWEG